MPPLRLTPFLSGPRKSATDNYLSVFYKLTVMVDFATSISPQRGVAQLVARVLWEHEVASSNLVAPIFFFYPLRMKFMLGL